MLYIKIMWSSVFHYFVCLQIMQAVLKCIWGFFWHQYSTCSYKSEVTSNFPYWKQEMFLVLSEIQTWAVWAMVDVRLTVGFFSSLSENLRVWERVLPSSSSPNICWPSCEEKRHNWLSYCGSPNRDIVMKGLSSIKF